MLPILALIVVIVIGAGGYLYLKKRKNQ